MSRMISNADIARELYFLWLISASCIIILSSGSPFPKSIFFLFILFLPQGCRAFFGFVHCTKWISKFWVGTKVFYDVCTILGGLEDMII